MITSSFTERHRGKVSDFMLFIVSCHAPCKTLCRTRQIYKFSFSLCALFVNPISNPRISLYMSVEISPAITGEGEGQLPFWLMNIPRNQWPHQCPEFLINSSARDKRILSIPNDLYQRATWEEVQEYIRSLNLSHKGSLKCC